MKNSELLPLVIRDKKTGIISDELGKFFIDLCERKARRNWHEPLAYRDDIIAHAVEILCAEWKGFDETLSSNPFAYYSWLANKAMVEAIAMEKNEVL